ncbi:TVP38/TMEM64 family protein [Acuticoccus sp. I52.16.1]|uniref:TVP38/TMEM64 family protein n=1 Tax=Acuticoccus sp. I52.16.1 TaxID=2928472 RepID=UPI001FD009D7|nr:TVP38/TMEM64 family protein [Acuticoccus sp. I52.16.1]UOM33461.1 TVP38/TMEM64 family protein [Acuticoccus sp. I52.16.1]
MARTEQRDRHVPLGASPPSRNPAPLAADDGAPRRRLSLRRLWPLAVIAAAMVLFYALGLQDRLSLESIIRHNERLRDVVDAHFVATMGAYLALYAFAVAVSFPGASLITIVGGFLFGAVLGTSLTVVAATAGAVAIFIAARSSLGGVLREKAGPLAKRFADGFTENAFHYLLFLRLVPLFPFWLVNVAPALFEVPVRTYVLATAIGIIPGTLAYTLVGNGLGGLIAAQERANPGCVEAGTCRIELSALLTPGLLAAIVALSAAALIPVAVKRWRRAKAAA